MNERVKILQQQQLMSGVEKEVAVWGVWENGEQGKGERGDRNSRGFGGLLE
ncbi:hypothetical protein BaRGS_00032227, partial [Batillaria attramentaria]